MDQKIVEKTKALLELNACEELKTAAKAWLDAEGDEASTAEYIKQLKRGMMPVEILFNIFSGETAIVHFGAERAMEIVEHAQELMDVGKRFCDCPACTADLELLNLFGVQV